MRSVIVWPAALGLVFAFAYLDPPADGIEARADPVTGVSPLGWEPAQNQVGCQLDDLGESPPHRTSPMQPYLASDGDPRVLIRVLSFLRQLHPARIG
jgi:hypothetical protein